MDTNNMTDNNDNNNAPDLVLKELMRHFHPIDPREGIDDIPEMPDDTRAVMLQTELGNARRLVQKLQGKALHVEAWGTLLYNGKYWAIDHTGAMYREAVKMVDDLYEDARQRAVDYANVEVKARRYPDNAQLARLAEKRKGEADEALKWAMSCQTAQKINSMIGLAQHMIPAEPREFDADPWLFNVQNGTIDLRIGSDSTEDEKGKASGRFRAFHPGDRITRIAGTCVPEEMMDHRIEPETGYPTWQKCLNTWFDGDQDLINYIQKCVGYSLTGLTTEQCFWFLYGAGRNGKSVFTNTIARVMGDYFRKAQAQTFMIRRNQGGASDGLAGLIGARFVSCSEMTRDQKFDENLIKDITGGGDPVTARHLYKSEFTFQPALKLWMYGNSRPQITGTDLGIWRRVRLIPFTVIIPESDVDPNLTDKLTDELPGILAWAIAGCMKWQEEGLKMPQAVKEATEAYRSEEDVLAEFISENCVTGPGLEAQSSKLYDAFIKWGGDGSQRAFTTRMKERGYKVMHRETGARFQGIGLAADGN